VRPVTLEELEIVAGWREDCRQSLRTGHMVSRHQQAAYARQIADFSTHRMWAFHNLVVEEIEDPNEETFQAFGGLQGIQWENGLAEISLIVAPELRGRGVASKCVPLILAEAFDTLGLQQVWGEAYLTDPQVVSFWKRQKPQFQTLLPKRKFWDGKLWDSLYFAFFNE
jgi:RimJ/RimL family protein N-acetyltransferase